MNTVVKLNPDGVTTDFTYPAPRLDDKHVVGYVDEKYVSVTHVAGNTFRFDAAPAADSEAFLLRQTPSEEVEHILANRGYIRPDQLNNNYLQCLYVATDAYDFIYELGGTPGPEGPEGPEGKRGQQGPQGIPGKDGTDGKDGAPGTGIQLKGSATIAEIDALNPADLTIGDAYIMLETGTLADGLSVSEEDLIVWQEEGNFGNVGKIVGPEGPAGKPAITTYSVVTTVAGQVNYSLPAGAKADRKPVLSIAGIQQDPGEYTVSGTTVTLSEAAPAGLPLVMFASET